MCVFGFHCLELYVSTIRTQNNVVCNSHTRHPSSQSKYNFADGCGSNGRKAHKLPINYMIGRKQNVPIAMCADFVGFYDCFVQVFLLFDFRKMWCRTEQNHMRTGPLTTTSFEWMLFVASSYRGAKLCRERTCTSTNRPQILFYLTLDVLTDDDDRLQSTEWIWPHSIHHFVFGEASQANEAHVAPKKLESGEKAEKMLRRKRKRLGKAKRVRMWMKLMGVMVGQACHRIRHVNRKH